MMAGLVGLLRISPWARQTHRLTTSEQVRYSECNPLRFYDRYSLSDSWTFLQGDDFFFLHKSVSLSIDPSCYHSVFLIHILQPTHAFTSVPINLFIVGVTLMISSLHSSIASIVIAMLSHWFRRGTIRVEIDYVHWNNCYTIHASRRRCVWLLWSIHHWGWVSTW